MLQDGQGQGQTSRTGGGAGDGRNKRVFAGTILSPQGGGHRITPVAVITNTPPTARTNVPLPDPP